MEGADDGCSHRSTDRTRPARPGGEHTGERVGRTESVARDDEPIRLVHRELGIGGLAAPPTFVFRYRPGPATLASLVSLEGERFRLVVAEGENLDLPPLPALEMPYGQFRPSSGLRACMDSWLAHGGTHHMVLNLGHHAEGWRTFARLAGIDCVVV